MLGALQSTLAHACSSLTSMAHDVARIILELAHRQHEQEAQQREQEAQQRQAEDIASHRYQLQIGCSAENQAGGGSWRNDNIVSLRFSSHNGGVVRWLPLGAQMVCSTSKEAALSLIPQMMIQEFYRLHGQMEGSMLKTHLVWVSLAAGQRQSPHSVHWAFPSGGDMLCEQFVWSTRMREQQKRSPWPASGKLLRWFRSWG